MSQLLRLYRRAVPVLLPLQSLMLLAVRLFWGSGLLAVDTLVAKRLETAG
jgi:hypothetical protein